MKRCCHLHPLVVTRLALNDQWGKNTTNHVSLSRKLYNYQELEVILGVRCFRPVHGMME
jgi:hypothetical protein